MIDWIKKMRETEKGKTLLKFILYMTFLAFVLVLFYISKGVENPLPGVDGKSTSSASSEPESTFEEKTLTYYEKQEKLYSSDYTFTYTYKGETSVTFYGVFESGVVDALKETEEELIRYTVVAGIAYKKEGDLLIEYPELYREVDENLFDLRALFQRLNGESAKIEKTENYKVYNYSFSGRDYRVTTDDKTIKKIEISNELENYTMEFTY